MIQSLLPLLALLSTGVSSFRTEHPAYILSPHIPPLIRDAVRSHVWTPTFPVHTPPTAATSAKIVNLEFRNLDDHFATHATTIHLGTPPQPVTVELDLLSADFMAVNHKVGTHHYYDHAKSTTYQVNGTHYDEGGTITGFVSRDTITLGDPDKTQTIQATSALFLEVTGQDSLLKVVPTDGTMGFGAHTAFSTGAPSFIRGMIQDDAIEESVVGLHFSEQGASVMVGGVDSALVDGSITYFDMAGTHLWSVPVTGISVAGKPVADMEGGVGVFDIYPLMVGPRSQVDAISDAVGVENGALPCDGDGPEITFTIGAGIEVTLTKQDYALPTKYDNVCRFAMVGVAQEEWLLNLPVLRKVYLVLDYGTSEGASRTGVALSRPRP